MNWPLALIWTSPPPPTERQAYFLLSLLRSSHHITMTRSTSITTDANAWIALAEPHHVLLQPCHTELNVELILSSIVVNISNVCIRTVSGTLNGSDMLDKFTVLSGKKKNRPIHAIDSRSRI